jgi:hypothetical protein
MIRHLFISASSSSRVCAFSGTCAIVRTVVLGTLALSLGGIAAAQVITIDTKSGNVSNATGTVDRRFAQIKPTNIDLPKTGLDTKTRLELIRVLQSEQGWAMRPFPRGHKGLTLEANGNLSPVGESYLDMVTQFGLSAKPGDGVVLTDIKFDKSKIIFMINGGPDAKHRFLRHIEIGTGDMDTPVVQGDQNEATGARITLQFKGGVPAMTATQVKALLSPLISFDVKTPVQAFTDTLPPKLKEAILNHDVWVGMSTDMVLFAKGAPERKVREVDGQMPFEEWIYGEPPKPVEFVRINGNRVIRVEIAKVGEAPEIFTKDEVEGLMRTDGTPLAPPEQRTRTIASGDVERNPDTQAPAPPPTLAAPSEKLPDAARNPDGQMRPVQFPKQKPDDYPDATNLPRDPKQVDNEPANGKAGAKSSTDKPSTDKLDQPATPSSDNSSKPSQPASTPAPTKAPAPPATPDPDTN